LKYLDLSRVIKKLLSNYLKEFRASIKRDLERTLKNSESK